jgi:hypothetical protein
VVGAAHHAADVALKGRELEHTRFVHLLERCKRLSGSDGKAELPRPARGWCGAYADAWAFAELACRRRYDGNLLAVVR